MVINFIGDDKNGLIHGLPSSDSLRSGADSTSIDLDKGEDSQYHIIATRLTMDLATLFGEELVSISMLLRVIGPTYPVLGCVGHINRDGISFV